MTTLYETDYLSEMALEPCVWTTNWNVDDHGRLHLFVKQRSCDVCAGFPFNVLQYHLLHRRIAQVTGRELGSMYWTIDNAHIYDRHIETVHQQVNQDLSDLELTQPELILPSDLDYFQVPLSEAQIVNYQHNGSFKFEIAI
ncbi:thymidylate synthase [Hutsoniella sourekii]